MQVILKGEYHMNWKMKLTALVISGALTIPAGQAHAFLSGIDKQDGGIGNTENYLDKVPNLALDPKVDNIIYPLMSTPAIKRMDLI